MKDYYIEKRGKIYYFRFKDPLSGKILPARSSSQKNRDLAINGPPLSMKKSKRTLA
jgi:hypothetical protein